jgi:hypothetical protein
MVSFMTPWFIATEKFDPSEAGWPKYIAWSGLKQLDEVVSLDTSLCPTVLPNIKPEYCNHIVNEDFMLHFFTDLDYLRGETVTISRKTLRAFFEIPLPTLLQHKFPEGSRSSWQHFRGA